MVGVFDSGEGGVFTLKILRKLAPKSDLCFLADRKNAPYGTKSDDEIIDLATKCIRRLKLLGAERVLIACCTASSLHAFFPRDEKEISIPIIEPSARRAAISSRTGKIGVIATDATVRLGEFGRQIRKIRPDAEVIEVPASPLVPIIEGGARDGSLSRDEFDLLRGILTPFTNQGIDTLVLGCTHFPHLEKTISGLMPGVKIVSSSREGARLAAYYTRREHGRTVYTE